MCSLAQGDLSFDPSEDSSDSMSEVSMDNLSERSTLCRKCGIEESTVVLRKKDVYCRQCFVVSVTHKFRSSLGKRRVMRHNDVVAVDFDGNSNSMSIMKLINSSLDEENVKRVVYTPHLVIVYDSRNIDNLEKIIEKAKSFGHQVYLVGLHECFDEKTVEPLRVDESTDPEIVHILSNCRQEIDSQLGRALASTLEQTTESTARNFLIENLHKKVLLASASALKCTKIFTTESSWDLAVKIISGIATGRGQHLVCDAGFQDDSGSVEILRPLKDFSLEEILIYNGEEMGKDGRTDEKDPNSISKLSQNFIFGLQENFPATIPTICRTGDKLSQERCDTDLPVCALCNGQLDIFTEGCTATDATEFSKQMSKKKLIPDMEALNVSEKVTTEPCSSQGGDGDCCSAQEGSCCQSSKGACGDISPEVIKNNLCYGCRIVLYKMSSQPKFMLDNIRTQINRQKMKSEISDFLL